MAMVKIINNCPIFTPSGSKIAPVYERVFDDKLNREVVKQVNQFDLDEFIQASDSKTDLALLRAQMQETGQIPVVDDEIEQSAALMPNNIHELYDVVKSVDKQFNALPESVRSCFKDKDDFLNALTSGTYSTRLEEHFNKLVNDSLEAAKNVNLKKEEGVK